MFREGLGSFFGTIGGGIADPEPSKPKYRDRIKPTPEKSNFKVNPMKEGSGYGCVFMISFVWLCTSTVFSV